MAPLKTRGKKGNKVWNNRKKGGELNVIRNTNATYAEGNSGSYHKLA